MKRLGALPEDDSIETRTLFAKSQAVVNKMAREILGTPPRETPAGIWPQTLAEVRSEPASAPVEAPRRPPVATGSLPSGTTVVREIKFEEQS